MQMPLSLQNNQSSESKEPCARIPNATIGVKSAPESFWPPLPPADLSADLTQCLGEPVVSPAEIWDIFRNWLERHLISPLPHATSENSSTSAYNRPATAVGGLSSDLISGPPLIITSRPNSMPLNWLSNLEADVLSDLTAAIEILSANDTPWSVVIIDLDGFGSISELYDKVRALRDTVDVPVILASSQCSDDFSRQRLPLCDVSLRAPASQAILRLALSQAKSNFAAWKIRRTEVGLPRQARTLPLGPTRSPILRAGSGAF